MRLFFTFPGIKTLAVLTLDKSQQKAKDERWKTKGKMEEREEVGRTVLPIKLVGSDPKSELVGLEELAGKSNYFIGNDPKKWRTDVPHYAKVKYGEIYPGIDLIYYGNQRQLVAYQVSIRTARNGSCL